jgi:hypothetical protein
MFLKVIKKNNKLELWGIIDEYPGWLYDNEYNDGSVRLIQKLSWNHNKFNIRSIGCLTYYNQNISCSVNKRSSRYRLDALLDYKLID